MRIAKHPTLNIFAREGNNVMAEIKLTNNPCKFCNGEIDEGKPLCGDLVDLGDVCCMVKAKEGFDLEYWKEFECMHFVKINFCPMCGRKLTEEK